MMVRVITKKEVFEIRVDDKGLVLYQSGTYRGKIISMRNIEVGQYGHFECSSSLNGGKGRRFWSTEVIKKIEE